MSLFPTPELAPLNEKDRKVANQAKSDAEYHWVCFQQKCLWDAQPQNGGDFSSEALREGFNLYKNMQILLDKQTLLGQHYWELLEREACYHGIITRVLLDLEWYSEGLPTTKDRRAVFWFRNTSHVASNLAGDSEFDRPFSYADVQLFLVSLWAGWEAFIAGIHRHAPQFFHTNTPFLKLLARILKANLPHAEEVLRRKSHLSTEEDIMALEEVHEDLVNVNKYLFYLAYFKGVRVPSVDGNDNAGVTIKDDKNRQSFCFCLKQLKEYSENWDNQRGQPKEVGRRVQSLRRVLWALHVLWQLSNAPEKPYELPTAPPAPTMASLTSPSASLAHLVAGNLGRRQSKTYRLKRALGVNLPLL